MAVAAEIQCLHIRCKPRTALGVWSVDGGADVNGGVPGAVCVARGDVDVAIAVVTAVKIRLVRMITPNVALTVCNEENRAAVGCKGCVGRPRIAKIEYGHFFQLLPAVAGALGEVDVGVLVDEEHIAVGRHCEGGFVAKWRIEL